MSLVNGIHFSCQWHDCCAIGRATGRGVAVCMALPAATSYPAPMRYLPRVLPLLSALALPACTLAAAPSSHEGAPAHGTAADTSPAPWCDCGGLPTTPCSRPACDDHGTCYLDHTPDGEAADVAQVHGDCLTAVCVGLKVVQVYEPHDRPTLPDECVASVCTPAGPAWVERDACLP